MGRWNLAVALMLLGAPALAAATLEATTSDGRKVVLSADGTWKYKDARAKEKDAGEHSRPAASTQQFQSPKHLYSLWYDPKKWTPEELTGGPAEFKLNYKGGDAYFMVIAERISAPVGTLLDIAVKNAQGLDPDASVVLREERKINGVTVTAMQMQAKVKGIPFTYFGYYWAGESGMLQLITFTSQNLAEEMLPEMTDLLNGAVITGK